MLPIICCIISLVCALFNFLRRVNFSCIVTNVHMYLDYRVATILFYKVVSVFCLSGKISRTTEPILFSFTVKLLVGPGKVLNYFGGGCLHPPPPKKLFFYSFFNSNLKWYLEDFSPPTPFAPRGF